MTMPSIGMGRATWEWVMSYGKWIMSQCHPDVMIWCMSYRNESCHVGMRHVIWEWVMAQCHPDVMTRWNEHSHILWLMSLWPSFPNDMTHVDVTVTLNPIWHDSCRWLWRSIPYNMTHVIVSSWRDDIMHVIQTWQDTRQKQKSMTHLGKFSPPFSRQRARYWRTSEVSVCECVWKCVWVFYCAKIRKQKVPRKAKNLPLTHSWRSPFLS